MSRILCIAAHPDDEVLGCGGTLAKFSRKGSECNVLIMGEGITSRNSYSGSTKSDLLKDLRCNAKEASDILGVSNTIFYDYPDNMFDTVPLLEMAKTIETVVEDTKPNIIFTHHMSDLNVDHSIVFRATLIATRPMAGKIVETVYTYEVPSSSEWSFSSISPEFRPNTFFDISEELGKKIEAISLYKTELRDYPHPRSKEALRSIAMKWGSTVGCEAAEAFVLVRDIKR